MDVTLGAWARAVKARRRFPFPPLWLFTDEARLPDPLPAAKRLPRGLGGIVFRHDAAAERLALGRALARVCRARRLMLVVAGDARLAAALGAGLHLRRGRKGVVRRRPGFLTASAHDRSELVRAGRAGVDLVFLGPASATRSHVGVRPLGAVRWNALAGRARVPVAALGGIGGGTIRRLPRAAAAAAIRAFSE
ncbi:MAG: thiamine phosphate synthase [Acetobacteraceae bacterium]